MLMIRILGPVGLVLDDRDLDISGFKERALLALLTSNLDRQFSVESIIEQLWDRRSVPTNAASGVHVFVSRLRRQLGPYADRIVRHKSGYSIELSADELDARVFDRLVLESADLVRSGNAAAAVLLARDALALWRGRPFEGVSTPLIDAEAALLDTARSGALDMLFEAELAAGSHAQVISEIERAVAERPFNEHVRALLMLALYRSGRQADALRAYRDLRTLTRDELGLEPTPELQRLQLALLEHDPSLEWAPGDPVLLDRPRAGRTTDAERTTSLPVPGLAETANLHPLIGRDAELAAIAEVVAARAPHRLRALAISGEAGAGKTRLVIDGVLEAHRQGATVVVGTCDEDTPGPYQPIAEIVRWLLDQLPADVVRPALPEVTTTQLRRLAFPSAAGGPTSPHSDANPVELFEAVAALLRLVAATSKLVVVLEDVHWIDPPTSSMLRYLVRRLESDPVVIVCTSRPLDVQRSAPAQSLLDLLQRAAALRTVRLNMLEPAEVAELAQTVLGRSVSPAIAETVHAETGGNPLFVVELFRHLLETGELGEVARIDEFAVVQQSSPPHSIRELVERRLRRFPSVLEEALSLAAVMGRDFDRATLTAALAAEPAAVADVLDDAEAVGMVVPSPDVPGRYTFTHALIRRTLYDRIPAARRSALHRSIAVTLEEAGTCTASQLAHHYFEAAAEGAPDKAFAYAVQAAVEAQRTFAYEDSLAILQRTLRLAEVKGTDHDRILLELALGDAYWWAGDVERSQAICASALALAQRAEDHELFARAVLGRWRNNGAATQGFSASAPDHELLDMIEDALNGLTDNASLRAALLGRLGIASYWTAPLDRRQELADSAVALARAAGNESVLLDVLVDRQLTLWAPGSERQRLERSVEIVTLARRLGQSAREADARCFEAVDRLALGEVDEADAAIRRYLRSSAQLRQPFYRWHAHYLPALRALMEGRFDEAESLTAAATDTGETESGQAEGAVMLSGLQTLWLFYERGSLDQIAPLLEAVADTFGDVPAMDAARTWVAAETGSVDLARAHLNRLAQRDFDIDETNIAWLAAMCLLSSAAATLGDRDTAIRLRDILTPYSGRTVLVWVGFCCGPVDYYLGKISAMLGDLDDATASLDAAADLTRSMRAEPLLLRVLLERCRVAARRGPGHQDAITADLVHIVASAERMGMAGVRAEAAELLADPEAQQVG